MNQNDHHEHNNNGGDEKWFNRPPEPEEDRFRDGMIDGFTRARQILWRDYMRRAGECRLMAENAESQQVKDTLSAQEVAYRNAADIAARSHTLYPGALEKDADPDDPRFTIKYDDDLFRY